MSKFFKKAFLPMFLALVILISFVVPVSASELSDYFDFTYFSQNISSWVSNINSYYDGDSTDDHGPYWCSTPWAVANHVEVTQSALDSLSLQYNNEFKSDYKIYLTRSFIGDTGLYGLKICSSDTSNYALCWLADSSGRAIVASPDNETDGGAWISLSNIGTVYHMLSREALQNLATAQNAKVMTYNQYYFITNDRGTVIYADSSGLPFAAYKQDSSAAVNSDREDTSVDETDSDGTTETTDNTDSSNTTGIDLSTLTITLPDGSVQVADAVIYDESTKCYTIDSHDTYNTYNTYYYTWNYYINYTSITYIGTTEEYNKYYEVYYELPDGRDSADLTAEELEQLNLDIDVINYGRSADDTSLRSLYHFDGDTRDSSYWNYCTDFTWNKGASITYMDAGTFDGALYLDETEHDFTLTLPSVISSSDFTFQFRYYQSYTAAPQTDSYLKLGDTTLLQFDGASFKNAAGTALSSTPVGSWSEIALVRNAGTLYYYLNGVSIGSVVNNSGFSNSITFHFGQDQQTYKELDEMRFLNYAISAGDNYTCTSVPYDTNLTFVLPDSAVPVADEYVQLDESSDVLTSWDLTSGSLSSINNGLTSYQSLYTNTGYTGDPYLTYDYSGSGVTINCDSTKTGNSIPGGLWFYPYYYGHIDFGSSILVVAFDSTGKSYSFTMSTSLSLASGDDYSTSVTIVDGLKFCRVYHASNRILLGIYPASGSITLNRIEILPYGGTPSNESLITSVTAINSADLNTPTLAVRSSVAVTSYQIGGARPSLPTEGQVWALVEGGYITSLQIYNGSAWESCDGRIWTGSRWIPYSSYNVITLQDMYDIVDSSGDDYEYIYTESGFWDWWERSWNDFTGQLFSSLGTGGITDSSSTSSVLGGEPGSGTSLIDSIKDGVLGALKTLIEGVFALIKTILEKLLSLAKDLLSFFFDFLSAAVLGSINAMLNAFKDASLFQVFSPGDGSTGYVLPEGVPAAFTFISGVYLAFPDTFRGIFTFGIAASFLFAILKLFKS